MQRDVIAYSWWWLNRLEHFGWWAALKFVVSLGCLIGNLNEFWEFGLRQWAGTAARSVLYLATILDMITNLPGALLASLIGSRVTLSGQLRPEPTTPPPAPLPAADRRAS